MRGCSSAAPAATSFNKLLSSPVASGRAPIVLCSPPETQIGVLRFLGSGGGDFASSRRNLLPLVCFGRNPIRSVANSSTPILESQDELEAINESQPHLPDQENLSSVRIKIQMRKECQFGEQYFVVGSQPELGLWNPLHAIPMTWADDHLWTAELDLPIGGEPIRFKLLLREVNGELLWQPGQDRVFHTWKTNNIIRVFEDWENPEAQHVTEEQESDALMTETKQLEHSNEKYIEADETVTIVADDISHHTKTDTDRVRSEGQIFSTPEISGNRVVDENVVSRTVIDEVAISDKGLIASEDVLEKEQVPSLVPGLYPCSTSPTEDVTVKEQQVKLEPDISNIVSDIKAQNPELDQKQEKVKGHSELEEATSRLRFNDEHAPTPLEHLNELAPNNDGDVNGHPNQDLESAFSESQINKGTDLWGDDIKWGQSALKRFLNNLGFL